MTKLPDRLWRLPRREGDEAAEEEEGIGRILARSDGVFAIAVTVLVFGIAVPTGTMNRPGFGGDFLSRKDDLHAEAVPERTA